MCAQRVASSPKWRKTFFPGWEVSPEMAASCLRRVNLIAFRHLLAPAAVAATAAVPSRRLCPTCQCLTTLLRTPLSKTWASAASRWVVARGLWCWVYASGFYACDFMLLGLCFVLTSAYMARACSVDKHGQAHIGSQFAVRVCVCFLCVLLRVKRCRHTHFTLSVHVLCGCMLVVHAGSGSPEECGLH